MVSGTALTTSAFFRSEQMVAGSRMGAAHETAFSRRGDWVHPKLLLSTVIGGRQILVICSLGELAALEACRTLSTPSIQCSATSLICGLLADECRSVTRSLQGHGLADRPSAESASRLAEWPAEVSRRADLGRMQPRRQSSGRRNRSGSCQSETLPEMVVVLGLGCQGRCSGGWEAMCEG